MRRLILVFFLALLMSPSVFGAANEGSQPKPKVIYRKSKVIDFEDSLIRGKIARPGGDTLSGKEESASDIWMSVRSNFRDRVGRQRRAQR